MTSSPGGGNQKPSIPYWLVYPIAVLALVGFVCFILYMLGLKSSSELEWTRSVYLFSGVEAIAFAAAGFLFGKEVHRKRAESAEGRSEKAENEATTSRAEAIEAKTNGEAIVDFIDAMAQAQEQSSEELERFGPSPAVTRTRADLEKLRDFAHKRFPR